jgi:hypothetical protein
METPDTTLCSFNNSAVTIWHMPEIFASRYDGCFMLWMQKMGLTSDESTEVDGENHMASSAIARTLLLIIKRAHYFLPARPTQI